MIPRPVKMRLSADMVSVVKQFELLHDFPVHRVCANGRREVCAQSLHGTGIDELISEDNRDLVS